MYRKYIQDTILLTKEDFIKYITQQQQLQADEYGLSLEEYQQAILNGSVVEAKLFFEIQSNETNNSTGS